MPRGKRLSADDWTRAALDALAEGGVAAVAVEPLAVRLGTTKGSFYWHFADRDALLAAALAEWERVATDGVIATIAAEPDARRRLLLLLRTALGGHRHLAGTELALQPAARHPLVEPVLARVTARRLAYLEDLFAGLGLPPVTARQRALLGYAAFLGQAQLRHVAPTGDELAAYAAATVDLLTGPVAGYA